MLKSDGTIFEDLLCLIYKVDQIENVKLRERSVMQIIIFFTYLIKASQEVSYENFEFVKSIGDSLNRTKNSSRYAILFYVLIFSKKYNKDAEFLKSKYLASEEALLDIMFKILEQNDVNMMMSKLFLLTLICSDSWENKMLISWKFNVGWFLTAYDFTKLSIEQQEELLSYTLELCLKKGINNSNFFFDADSSVKKLFKANEIQEIEDFIHQIETIKHTFI